MQSRYRPVRGRLPAWAVVEGDPIGDPELGAARRAPDCPEASRISYDIHGDASPVTREARLAGHE
jgi:hypothetical protein